MVFGAYRAIASQIRVDLHLVEVKTGSVLNTTKQTAPVRNLSGWRQAASMAGRDLLATQRSTFRVSERVGAGFQPR